jgi:hypothetical protein
MATQSILSTTLQLLRDKLVDNSYLAHPLFRAVEEHGNLIKVSGGLRVEQPVIFGDHSSITELTNGFEPVSMAVTDPFQSAKFEYANFTQPIILSAVEKAANKGDLAVVNILESKMKNVMLSLKKEVSKQVIKGDSSVLGSLETLNGMGTAAVAADTTGWFQSAAFGSQTTNTVGGLSKTTYQAQNWQNQIFDSAGSLALNHIDELMINCQIYHPAGTFPDILQQSSVQYISAGDRETLDKDMVGMWRGARIYVEPNLGFANAAGDTVSAYALSSDMFQLYADTDGFFTVSDMLPVPGTATEAAMVFNRMQLVTGINAES